MSENIRRVVLQQGAPLEDNHLRKRSKKVEKATYHIAIDIPLIIDQSKKYTEVNCEELLKKKLGDEDYKKYIEVTSEAKPGAGEDGEEDDDDVKKMAKYFEKKYGSGSNKVGCISDFYDLGMGYDDEDSFIDNAEAYDELMPSTIDTKFGGYYVNKGKLQFREVLNVENSNEASGSDSDGASTSSDNESSPETKKSKFVSTAAAPRKRSFSSSENECETTARATTLKKNKLVKKKLPEIKRPKIKITPTNAEKAARIHKRAKVVASSDEKSESVRSKENGGSLSADVVISKVAGAATSERSPLSECVGSTATSASCVAVVSSLSVNNSVHTATTTTTTAVEALKTSTHLDDAIDAVVSQQRSPRDSTKKEVVASQTTPPPPSSAATKTPASVPQVTKSTLPSDLPTQVFELVDKMKKVSSQS